MSKNSNELINYWIGLNFDFELEEEKLLLLITSKQYFSMFSEEALFSNHVRFEFQFPKLDWLLIFLIQSLFLWEMFSLPEKYPNCPSKEELFREHRPGFLLVVFRCVGLLKFLPTQTLKLLIIFQVFVFHVFKSRMHVFALYFHAVPLNNCDWFLKLILRTGR